MTIGKPVAAAAVDRLLMMDIRMPETCSVVFTRQVINLLLIPASGLLIHLKLVHHLSFIVYIIVYVYFISFVLRALRARPLWAVALSRRPDKSIDTNEAMLTYLYECTIKDFCCTQLLHAKVVMHTLTNSKIYCRLCTTTATTTRNTTDKNILSMV
jgi:hypothetical protein